MSAVSDFKIFIDKWTNPKYPPKAVTVDGLMSVEARYGLVFPQDYLDCVTTLGAPHTVLAFLSSVIHAEIDIADLSEFMGADEIIEASGWHDAGLPGNLVPFASDCMGNMFCFARLVGVTKRPEKAPVWFFDHDFITSEIVTDSFADLIKIYCDVPFNDAEV